MEPGLVQKFHHLQARSPGERLLSGTTRHRLPIRLGKDCRPRGSRAPAHLLYKPKPGKVTSEYALEAITEPFGHPLPLGGIAPVGSCDRELSVHHDASHAQHVEATRGHGLKEALVVVIIGAIGVIQNHEAELLPPGRSDRRGVEQIALHTPRKAPRDLARHCWAQT